MKEFIDFAIELSEKSSQNGGYPVGAVIVKNNEIIAIGVSDGKNKKDATSHAEMEAIRNASKILLTRDLHNCEIYSSMEPCLMCFSACYWAIISKITYAIGKDKLLKKHYEGLHNLQDLNLKNHTQIEIVHRKDVEEKALAIINTWEQNLKNNT